MEMPGDTPPSISDLVPGLKNSGGWAQYHALQRLPAPELTQFIGELGVEHGRIKSARLSDPRFASYYAHHSRHFLDEIERSYLRKLAAGQISLDDFFDAMKGYIKSHNSGSQGSRREGEAEHIVQHILAQLVQNLQLGRQEKKKSPKTETDNDRRRLDAEGPSALEEAVRDVTKSDGGEGR
jgi:hypothetical protein